MKRSAILLLLLFACQSVFAQVYDEAVRARGFTSPAAAEADLAGIAQLHDTTSIIPVRGVSYLTGTGVPMVTYVTLRQALVTEAEASAGYDTPLPAQNSGPASCPTICSGWDLLSYRAKSDFGSFASAQAYYDALAPAQKKTAMLISTAAANYRWVVVYQDLAYWIGIP